MRHRKTAIIKIAFSLLLSIFFVGIFIFVNRKENVTQVEAQTTEITWPMPGANPQRTSWTSGTIQDGVKTLWVKPIFPYVPQKVQVIGAENKVYVSTSSGLYAFDANSGEERWKYATALPLADSPTYDGGFLYVGGLDKKIHKIRASDGQGVWTFIAEGGFSTNPVVANGKVYMGSRDGYFYAVNTSDGSLAWKYQTGNQILQSAAFQPENDGVENTTQGTLYFASNDGYAYALNAATGTLVWKSSQKLPSMGFFAWWPVIYQNYVIFTRTAFQAAHHGPQNYWLYCQTDTCTIPNGVVPGKLCDVTNNWCNGSYGTTGGMAFMDVKENPNGRTYAKMYETFPHYRNAFFFNRSNGQEVNFDIDGNGVNDGVPMAYAGDAGTQIPPLVSGYNSGLYFRTNTRSAGGFGSLTIAGWAPNASSILTLPFSNNSGQSGFLPGDEPMGFSAAGDKIFWNHCCDRYVGAVSLSVPNKDFIANLDDGNPIRQWSYIRNGGLPFTSWPSNIGMPSNFYPEAVKFFWDPREGSDPPGMPAVFWNENDKVGPTPYLGKLYVILGNSLVAIGPGGAGSTAPLLNSATNVTPPAFSSNVTDTNIKNRLEQEVQKIVTAGHLKPSYMFHGLMSTAHSRAMDDYMNHYWHNPADIHLVLLRALPHLSNELQNKVKTYLQSEFNSYPPYTYAHVGFVEGTQRDPYPYPPAETVYRSFSMPTIGKTGAASGPWAFPPYNVYAMWKYAQAGLCVSPCSLSNLLTQAANRIKPSILTTDSRYTDLYLQGFPLVHNAYINGYIGYIELAKLAGQTSTQYAAYQTELNRLLELRKSQLMTFPNPQSPITCENRCYYESMITYYNFAYLTTDLANWLSVNARSSDPNKDILAILQKYQDIAPYWMMAHNGETQGESAIQPYQQTHSLFQALARIKRAPRSELVKYLDTPIVPVGDLYYIDNLVAVLESAGSLTPTPTPTLTPTPTPTISTCTLTSATWGSASIIEGTSTTLTVNASGNCVGKQANFVVRRHKTGLPDENAQNQPTPNPVAFAQTGTVYSATTTWTADAWVNNCLVGTCDPVYFFKVNVVGETTIMESNPRLITVTKVTTPPIGQPGIITIPETSITLNTNRVPKYDKLEITFDVLNSVSKNVYLPYEKNTPAGVSAELGITVNAQFTPDNWQTVYNQPAFYYEEFEDQTKLNNPWFYPKGTFKWKVRFAPNKEGTWKYKLSAVDKSGRSETTEKTFSVDASTNKGFIKVAQRDNRYFEFDNGTYFPALGYNMNGGDFDWVNPVNGNKPEFEVMKNNGIELTRVWVSQASIWGSTWGKWASPNPVHQTQEHRMGLAFPGFSEFSRYPNLVGPTPVAEHDVYVWLNFDETRDANNNQPYFTPCRLFAWEAKTIPLKQNANYKVRVRYQANGIVGTKVAGQPTGFVIKEGGWLWNNSADTGRCYMPGTGNVIAATYNPPAGKNWRTYDDTENPGWKIMEGTYASGTKDFVTDRLYIAIENALSPGTNLSGGHVFVDQVWFQEDLGNGSLGTNLIYKPSMDHHKYVNQRDSFALDKILDLAKENNIYLKAVMNEKNDSLLQSINFDGSIGPNKSLINFFGNGREATSQTKVRWLEKAWWRYMQARWGYSTNIHSWEFINEGPPNNTDGHFTATDEFGEFMHCGVFGIDEPANTNFKCTHDHPNDHLTSTSTWQSIPYPSAFWKNVSGEFNDVDYADRHLYAEEGVTDPTLFNDSALFSQNQSIAVFNQQLGKPMIRGETAWSFSGTDLFATNADRGKWLHKYIWAGINHGGLIEHFFGGGRFTWQIFKSGSHDHRSMFGNYYRFIKDIPLNNGKYTDAAPVVPNTNLRAWGQKDIENKRAHLWIQNIADTWRNVVNNVTITPQSGTVTISGFTPNTDYTAEWWNTSTGSVSNTQTIKTDSTGNLQLQITNLTTDIAVKIGNYTPVACTSNGLVGDIDKSGKVTSLDLTSLIGMYGSNNVSGDLNCDGNVNMTDVSMLIGNFGKKN